MSTECLSNASYVHLLQPPSRMLAAPNVLELDDASSHLLVWALSPLEVACMLSFVASSYSRYLLDETSMLVMSAVTRLP
jgi:hypothetical protein